VPSAMPTCHRERGCVSLLLYIRNSVALPSRSHQRRKFFRSSACIFFDFSSPAEGWQRYHRGNGEIDGGGGGEGVIT
jgi:hypothetical protein